MGKITQMVELSEDAIDTIKDEMKCLEMMLSARQEEAQMMGEDNIAEALERRVMAVSAVMRELRA